MRSPVNLRNLPRTLIIPKFSFGSAAQLLEQRLGLLQVGGVEALGEPVVDFREYRACLIVPAAWSTRPTRRFASANIWDAAEMPYIRGAFASNSIPFSVRPFPASTQPRTDRARASQFQKPCSSANAIAASAISRAASGSRRGKRRPLPVIAYAAQRLKGCLS